MMVLMPWEAMEVLPWEDQVGCCVSEGETVILMMILRGETAKKSMVKDAAMMLMLRW